MGGFESVFVRRIVVPGSSRWRCHAIGALAYNDREVLPLAAPWLDILIPVIGGNETSWRVEIAYHAWQLYRQFWRLTAERQLYDDAWIFGPAATSLRSQVHPRRWYVGEVESETPLWQMMPYLAWRIFGSPVVFPRRLRPVCREIS